MIFVSNSYFFTTQMTYTTYSQFTIIIMATFQFGLFECLADKDTCLITTLAPCFTLSKNAEMIGGNCLLYGMGFFTCCYGILGGKVRQALRERYDIPVRYFFNNDIFNISSRNQELWTSGPIR